MNKTSISPLFKILHNHKLIIHCDKFIHKILSDTNSTLIIVYTIVIIARKYFPDSHSLYRVLYELIHTFDSILDKIAITIEAFQVVRNYRCRFRFCIILSSLWWWWWWCYRITMFADFYKRLYYTLYNCVDHVDYFRSFV